MSEVKTADIVKLRKMTGAGMMDCKNALIESNGDLDRAVDLIRERGKAIANKRADREAGEGAALADVTADQSFGAIVVLNCETDFVAKNQDFVDLTKSILNKALDSQPDSLEALLALQIDGRKIADLVMDQSGVTGEKFELSAYQFISAPMVVWYVHPGNKLATIVGFSTKVDERVGKDIAMQVAAMSPVSVDEDDVPEKIRKQEFEIGREQARLEGKPENMLDKIAEGKVKKFIKESTLMNQAFIKDAKMTIMQYLQGVSKDIKVTGFRRVSLS